MRQTELKTKVITFRIPESAYREASKRARLADKDVGEWARDEIVGRLGEKHGFTPAERLVLAEINNLRELIETIMIAGKNKDNNDRYIEVLTYTNNRRAQAAHEYFSRLAKAGDADSYYEDEDRED